ncbi:phosphoethanolamine transferase [Halarcobacter ebronensis]|uniref:Phosphoethanolamine transferase n=1 Tax=Halarcobacter ebronensis TaxID=1462615 RepID=A0A4Q0YBT3_9BACT|nr:phosphoethanolamine--lipid A transferase [Halarcobacter ebronensis]RXJ66291.1 phosphoethanolamine transferase [Halarcobacter ebronensis]
MLTINRTKLILLVSLYLTLFYNFTFFRSLLDAYPLEGMNYINIFSVALIVFLLNNFLFTLFGFKYLIKPLLFIVVIVSSFVAYFMDSYSIVVDTEMIRNTLQTNLNESMDLFNFKLVLYFLFLGLLPAFFIYKTKINYSSTKKEILSKLKSIILSLLLIAIIIFSFSKFYSSFFREHKPLRYNVNPTYWIYSVGKYIGSLSKGAKEEFKTIGDDAKVVEEESEDKELIILVVGETARADRFSLNGYKKETNPLLKKEDIINFPNMYSCGTSTAVSVPCMFSIYDKADYDYEKGVSTENILDVLNDTKDIKILWRDNNSDSKGVALRVDYEDYKIPKNNTICDEECRDEGMLVGLDKYIEKNKGKDILIVLHQMGNHGPAYYKRYPKEFEKFTPVCKTNELQNCTNEEINNAYDNAILYTDYFLSKVINFLKPYSKKYETAMIYLSDHGESLGENGIYLHGMPYMIAPEVQKHIPAVLWLGEGEMREDYDLEKVRSYSNREFTQDNLFHTLLGLFEVETKSYKKEMDILNESRVN